MKKLLRCPKCSGKKIWVIEKFRIPSETAEGRVLPVLPHQDSAESSGWMFKSMNPVGHLDLYLCDGCGYSELWADNFRSILENERKNVRLLDTSGTNDGPFR